MQQFSTVKLMSSTGRYLTKQTVCFTPLNNFSYFIVSSHSFVLCNSLIFCANWFIHDDWWSKFSLAILLWLRLVPSDLIYLFDCEVSHDALL